MLDVMQNWAGNYTFQAANVESPQNVEAITNLIRTRSRVRAVGTRHCFNDIADSPGETMISLAKMNRVIAVDQSARRVTVEAGITYGELAPQLHLYGLALPNLASLPHISVAGAVATGTHGSGERNGNLSTAVAELELIDGDGEIRTLCRGESDFDGAVVGLGCLGIVTRLTLDCVPDFRIAQTLYQDLPFKLFIRHLDEIVASAYSISLFTDWQSDTINQVWLKCMVHQPPIDMTVFSAKLATRQLHPIEGPLDATLSGIDPSKCTDQLGVPGPWHERLPHFKLEFTPSSGEELQSEYFIPRDRAAEAYAAIAKLRDQIRPLIQISELRFIAADNLWLSGSYARETAAIHFTWRRDQPRVDALLRQIESALEPFDARPHWGKRFVVSPRRLQTVFSKFADFKSMADQFDPHCKFRNDYCKRIGIP